MYRFVGEVENAKFPDPCIEFPYKKHITKVDSTFETLKYRICYEEVRGGGATNIFNEAKSFYAFTHTHIYIVNVRMCVFVNI